MLDGKMTVAMALHSSLWAGWHKGLENHFAMTGC